MNPKLIIVPIIFLLIISITACSNSKSINSSTSSSTSNTSVLASKIENGEKEMPSEKIHTVTTEEILNILSTKNNDVISSLGLSDSDSIKSLNGEEFYVPVFRCEESGILIGFNGASFDSIDKVEKEDDTPNFIMPVNGTIISFDKNISFRIGDDIKLFKEKFGNGKEDKDWGLKGDRQYCFLTYDINNLGIRFTSLDGDDFKKYDVFITKSQPSPEKNPAGTQTISKDEQYIAKEAYKSVLQNKSEFYSAEDKKNVFLNDFINRGLPEYDVKVKVTHFAILDMDGDKIPEVVLELSVDGEYPEFYEILHYMNGGVYGYNVVYRGLEDLKADGTSWGSSGALDNSCEKLKFSPDGYEYDVLAYSESNYDNDEVTVSYFINNKPVTEEAFDSFSKEQNEKKDAVWYEFTPENVETELSDN